MNKAPASLPLESSDTTPSAADSHCRQTFLFWFSSNCLPVTLAIGFIGPQLGLAFWHSTLAILSGVLLGSLVPAFLPAPQRMILLPLCLLLPLLHLDALARIAVHLLPGQVFNWQVLALLLAAAIALPGQALLRRLQGLLAPLLIIVFALLSLGAALLLEADTAQRQVHFSREGFATQLVAAALWQASFTPLSGGQRQAALYAGLVVSALWLMSLGALLASAVPAVDAVVSLRLVGERFYPGLGTLAVLLGTLPLLGAMALNGCALARRARNDKARGLLLAGFVIVVLALYLGGLPVERIDTLLLDLLH
ncbi:cytosine permease [Pseudomonas wadenswilerensis]